MVLPGPAAAGQEPAMARRRKDSGAQDGAGRWDRFLLSIMGPPTIGDVNAPIKHVEQPEDLCRRCGQPYTTHTVVRDPGLTYTRCPGPAGTEG
jgi:hypothetical protein